VLHKKTAAEALEEGF